MESIEKNHLNFYLYFFSWGCDLCVRFEWTMADTNIFDKGEGQPMTTCILPSNHRAGINTCNSPNRK